MIAIVITTYKDNPYRLIKELEKKIPQEILFVIVEHHKSIIYQETQNKNIIHISIHKNQNYSLRGIASLIGIQKAFLYPKVKYVIDIDADNCVEVADINSAIDVFTKQKVDCAILSRLLPESIVTNRSKIRSLLTKTFSGVNRLLIGKQIYDYSHTCRIYNKSLKQFFVSIDCNIKTPILNFYFLKQMIKQKKHIIELPCRFIENTRPSSIKAYHLLKYFLDYVKCIIKS